VRRPLALVVALVLGIAAGTGACSGSSGGSVADLCSVVSSGSFTDLFQRGLDPTDTDRALAQMKAASVDLGQLHDAAPSEVRGAVQDEITYVDAVTKVLQDTDPGDPTAVVNAVNALKAQRNAAQAASTKLKAFQAAHCSTSPSSG
jgi:hypothetical protein